MNIIFHFTLGPFSVHFHRLSFTSIRPFEKIIPTLYCLMSAMSKHYIITGIASETLNKNFNQIQMKCVTR